MQVMVNLHSAHMDPDDWQQPQQFRPERFLDESGNVIDRDRVIAFSLGKSTSTHILHHRHHSTRARGNAIRFVRTNAEVNGKCDILHSAPMKPTWIAFLLPISDHMHEQQLRVSVTYSKIYFAALYVSPNGLICYFQLSEFWDIRI